MNEMNNEMNELLQRELKEDEKPPILFFLSRSEISLKPMFVVFHDVIMGVKLLH